MHFSMCLRRRLRRHAQPCFGHDKSEAAPYINPRPAPSGFLALEKRLTGSQISSDGLDARRRRLLFRSWHRGIREMDLVLGRFADAQIAVLSDFELDEYERLLDIPDQQMFAWVSGQEATPADIDSALFRRLCDFHPHGPTSA
jgi:antitoxin CptB